MRHAIKPAVLTARLRQTFPEAAELRIRRSRGKFQISGRLHGKPYTKTLNAFDELSALSEAEKVLQDVRAGVRHINRTLPMGVLKHQEQRALQVLSCKGYRIQTEKAYSRFVQRAFSYLEDRGWEMSEHTLLDWILSHPKDCRSRGNACFAARLIGVANGEEIKIPSYAAYKQPPKGVDREHIDDTQLIDLLRRMKADGFHDQYRWIYSVAIFTGVRFNTVLTFRLTDDLSCIDGFDNKRKRKMQTGISLPAALWHELGLSEIPEGIVEYQMPQTSLATDEQLDAGNQIVRAGLNRFKDWYGKEMAKRYSARAIRSAVASRLLRSGMDIADVAYLLSTSVRALDCNYLTLHRKAATARLQRVMQES